MYHGTGNSEVYPGLKHLESLKVAVTYLYNYIISYNIYIVPMSYYC